MKIGYVFGLLIIAVLLASCKTASPAQPQSETGVLQDAYWMLLSLEGEDLQSPNNTRTAYIRFEEKDNDVNGFSGCNNFFGKYEITNNKLKLSKIGSTRMMCPVIEQETKLLRLLKQVDVYTISGDILTLYAGNQAVATFRTGNPDEIEPRKPDGKIIIKE
jgi:heat shock protein HslJ